MAIIKCKMCGGDLEITAGQSVAECEYCGSRQTIPVADNEKKLTLFSRANRLRFGCEFDKAAGIYESIVADFPQEAEAYWGLVLCKYGIEYVDDPATGKKIPTCHRSSFDSVMDDSNLEQALENADAVARKLYREEAKQIEEIRKGIIEVSGKEEPYDIFICYKETAEDGNRTLDSVLAQDVYDALTTKGYRVFFSRISLEDKLGVEYEPYIFAALNSAKIMLAFGTDYEYFNAVWVKNEWSRYLQLMTKDKSRHLIPCYKGIDAYDMPKEFNKLQAQDLGKVGAVQDLLRGIEKLLPRKKEPIPQVIVNSSGGAMTKRGYIYLEDGEFQKAAEYFDRGLDDNPEDSDAYIGKVMASMRVCSWEALRTKAVDLAGNNDFQRAVRYADSKQRERLCHIQTGNYAAAVTVVLTNLISAHNKSVKELRYFEEKWQVDETAVRAKAIAAGQRDLQRERQIVQRYAIAPYLREEDVLKALAFDFSYSSTLESRKKQQQEVLQSMDSSTLLASIQKHGIAQTQAEAQDLVLRIRNQHEQAVSSAREEDEAATAEIMDRYDRHLNECKAVVELYEGANAQRLEDYEKACSLMESGKYAWAMEAFQRTAQSGHEESRRYLQMCLNALEEEKQRHLQMKEAVRKHREQYFTVALEEAYREESQKKYGDPQEKVRQQQKLLVLDTCIHEPQLTAATGRAQRWDSLQAEMLAIRKKARGRSILTVFGTFLMFFFGMGAFGTFHNIQEEGITGPGVFAVILAGGLAAIGLVIFILGQKKTHAYKKGTKEIKKKLSRLNAQDAVFRQYGQYPEEVYRQYLKKNPVK